MEDLLYLGCKFFTRLSSMLRLFNLKERSGWTDKSFTGLLEFFKEMLLEGNKLSNHTYEAKKILYPMGLDYVKIHSYRNDCILYRKDIENMKECPWCEESRYKKKDNDVDDDDGVTSKGVPTKVMWYLLITTRIKILFSNVSDTNNTRWHENDKSV